MLIAIVPLVVLVVGLVLWFAATVNGKVSDAGRIMFACGLLVLVWMLANQTVRIGR